MKRSAVLVALCLVPSLVCAMPRKRAKPENYGTMRIQAEVFKRLIKHTLPLNSESLVFLGVYRPYAPTFDGSKVHVIDPESRVKFWAGHARYTKMQSRDEVYKRRLAKKYRHNKSDSQSYGGAYLTITDVTWVTPQDVEVEANILGKDWSEFDYSSEESYLFKLHKWDNRWRVASEKYVGGAG